MKHRHVFSAASVSTAQAALRAARTAGVPDADLSLIARSDIELQSIPDDRLDGTTDTIPAAIRGAVGGGAIGLLAGVAAVVPPLGITVAGAALIAVLGAAVGTWTAALVGSSAPNEVRRTFEEETAARRILLIIDAEQEALAAASQAVAAGARMLPFEGVSAAS